MPISPARAARVVRRACFDTDTLTDPRAARGTRHSFIGLLRLLVLGFACAGSSLRSIEELSERLQPKLRRRLGLRSRVSDTALYELLTRLPPEGFRESLTQQLRQELRAKVITNDRFPVGVVSLDGKGIAGGLGESPHHRAADRSAATHKGPQLGLCSQSEPA